jgi:hypothetical protein
VGLLLALTSVPDKCDKEVTSVHFSHEMSQFTRHGLKRVKNKEKIWKVEKKEITEEGMEPALQKQTLR